MKKFHAHCSVTDEGDYTVHIFLRRLRTPKLEFIGDVREHPLHNATRKAREYIADVYGVEYIDQKISFTYSWVS